MIEAISFSNHRISNVLFTAMNITGILLFVLAIVSTTAWYTSPPPAEASQLLVQAIARELQIEYQAPRPTWFLSGATLFFAHIGGGMLLLAGAQVLRYLSSQTETLHRIGGDAGRDLSSASADLAAVRAILESRNGSKP